MKTLCYTTLGLLTAAALVAQTGNRKVTENEKSPTAATSATIAGKKVTIEYNAPSARGRKVEGGLIPYGKPWRFGADSATTLTTEGDIMIGSLKVPAGVHTLYILASEGGGYKLIVNKQKGQWGTVYTEGQDLGRVDMKTTKLSAPAETLKITLTGSGNTGKLEWDWGATQATVPIKGA